MVTCLQAILLQLSFLTTFAFMERQRARKVDLDIVTSKGMNMVKQHTKHLHVLHLFASLIIL